MLKGLVIAGPTGVGKTDLSIKMAKLMKADIISADSAQVYKGMDIGTAKITMEEMQGIKHYMLDIVEPIKKYNVGDYQKNVDNILKEKEKVYPEYESVKKLCLQHKLNFQEVYQLIQREYNEAKEQR